MSTRHERDARRGERRQEPQRQQARRAQRYVRCSERPSGARRRAARRSRWPAPTSPAGRRPSSGAPCSRANAGQHDLDRPEAEAHRHGGDRERLHAARAQRAEQRRGSRRRDAGASAATAAAPMKASVPASAERGGEHERGRGRDERHDHGGDERAEREQQLDGHGVQRERGRARDPRGRRSSSGQSARITEPTFDSVNPVARPSTASAAAGAPISVSPISPATAAACPSADREEHGPLSLAVDQPALHRRADRRPEGERAADQAGHGERPARLREVEHDGEALDARSGRARASTRARAGARAGRGGRRRSARGRTSGRPR